jgi:hypothetical protein
MFFRKIFHQDKTRIRIMDHWIDEKRWNRMEMDEIKWNGNG